MDLEKLTLHAESLIFASDKPISDQQILDYLNLSFGFLNQKIDMSTLIPILNSLINKYQNDFYPFVIIESGGGYQFLSKKEYFSTISNINTEKFTKKLSNAAMETLAIIAYQQPITKSEIEKIRGVNCDYSIQKLLEKELIDIRGRNEQLPGRPIVYEVSKNLMDYFGLKSWDELPKINDIISIEQNSALEVSLPAQESITNSPL
ncbi:MAG: SMC-Scp complex subunit ScpB [Alphaproteobacteria bacterium]|nr:SMC-Scp complex subunit ScpB [Alphaproteobacteria bacterium]